MTNERIELTSAQMLATLVMGRADMAESMATVQRSHRFPLHIFAQIENMARIGKVPVSAIINQLIECGLEAVKKELPKNVVQQIKVMSQEQVDRPSKSVKWEVKKDRVTTKPKAKSTK